MTAPRDAGPPAPETAERGRADATAQKVRFLSEPSNWPGQPADVARIETHMSWVFLGPDTVLKLKKPVKTSYLDFTTPDARKADCEAEVTLNRRLSSDVYLGVIALFRRPDGTLSLTEDGTPVDWLVKMRRLPGEATLDRQIREGRLNERALRNALDRLSQFYVAAAPEPLAPATYRARFSDEVDAIEKELETPDFGVPADEIDGATVPLRAFLNRERAALDARANANRIVECHGDLRPEHIFLTPEPQIIDCLEFKRAFRLLDPAEELAFLSMECRRLGAARVRAIAFETYGRVTGDRPPDKLIDFYAAFRASLRAKLTISHLRDEHVRTPDRWASEARQYLALSAETLNGPGVP